MRINKYNAVPTNQLFSRITNMMFNLLIISKTLCKRSSVVTIIEIQVKKNIGSSLNYIFCLAIIALITIAKTRWIYSSM